MESMKNIHSSYKQKRKVILAALILPCILIACGLAAQQKIITHQVDSEFISQQGNYSTVVYGFYSKYTKRYKLASIDGKKLQVNPKATDHYRLKPGLHTVVFEEVVSESYPFSVRIAGYSLYKKEITFESAAGVKYVFAEKRDLCVSKKEGSSKSLNFFSYYQLKVKEADSEKIVSNPIDGEFQPIIGEGRRKGLLVHQILHLYDGPELQDDKIARFEWYLNIPVISGIKISGLSIDGSKILYNPSQDPLYGSYENMYNQFALLPGTYSIALISSKAYTSGPLFLHALAGNSYRINYERKSSFFSSSQEYKLNIEKVTEQEK